PNSAPVIEMMVKLIWRAPLSAAVTASSPSSCRRITFSTTMMASSTMKPIEIVIAISDKLSRLYSSRYSTTTVPPTTTGMVRPGTTVGQNRLSNSATTSTTRTTAIATVRCTSATDARMSVVRSYSTWTLMDGGIQWLSFGRSSFTWSTISTMLASGCLKTKTSTLRRSPNQPATLLLMTSSLTLATSPSRTG